MPDTQLIRWIKSLENENTVLRRQVYVLRARIDLEEQRDLLGLPDYEKRLKRIEGELEALERVLNEVSS